MSVPVGETMVMTGGVVSPPPVGVVNTTTSRGPNNREIVRVRPFVRVAGNLSLSVSDLSANIPPFNAQKMMLADGVRPEDCIGSREIIRMREE